MEFTHANLVYTARTAVRYLVGMQSGIVKEFFLKAKKRTTPKNTENHWLPMCHFLVVLKSQMNLSKYSSVDRRSLK